MKRFQLIAGGLLLLAAVGGAVWFFAVEQRRPGLAGTVRLAGRIMGVAVCAAIGLAFLRGGLVSPPPANRPADTRPPDADEEDAW